MEAVQVCDCSSHYGPLRLLELCLRRFAHLLASGRACPALFQLALQSSTAARLASAPAGIAPVWPPPGAPACADLPPLFAHCHLLQGAHLYGRRLVLEWAEEEGGLDELRAKTGAA